MHKFVPRLRKHKAIARLKIEKEAANYADSATDSNAFEYIPTAKAEIQEKKQCLKEELRKEGKKINGKKAKRLEKYIENKLKKDENRKLISRLATSRTDTSLYQSSSTLGQGRETKRQRLSRALRDSKAGIDIDGDNEEFLFEERVVKEATDLELLDDGSTQAKGKGFSQDPISTTFTTQVTAVSVGAGLKRPLQIGEDGRPVLKKRKRRGVKSKISLQHQISAPEEQEWRGLSSASEMSTDSEEKIEELHDYNDVSDASEDASNQGDSSPDGQAEISENEAGSSNDSEEGEVIYSHKRSSAFKTWANQQLHEALGYERTSNIPLAIQTPKIAGFEPRVPEEDLLPLELQPTSNTSRKAYSVQVSRTAEIQNIRLQLPVTAEEQKIMEAIHNQNVVVIYGATGSGKTTQVPQFLFEAGYGSPNSPTPGIIGVTQPRRVAAVSMAKRVGDELGDHGNRVAYQIRFEGTVSPNTSIKFMTDGVLLREVGQDILLRKYSAVIIDEAHERSVNTDILVGVLSRVVKLRDEMAKEDSSVNPLKLIIMSATLRVTDFTENTTLFATPPPVLQAEGRQFPVVSHFARKTHHDYVEEAFRKIVKGHKKLPPGGFLVFLTGQNEIASLSKRLKKAFRIGHSAAGPQVKISGKDAPIEAEDIDFGKGMKIGDDYDDEDDLDINLDDDEFDVGEEAETAPTRIHILPLYSLLPTKEQLKVFEPPPDGSRLIILATNIAETSLTIPGIRYVFDSGRSKERKYDQVTGVQSFEIGWISKASASQRAGRAGRTGPGHCYRLYSSAVYERDFPEFIEPEILRMPIEGVVLQLKAMNLQHVVKFPFPTPPDRLILANAEKLLTYLSAISPTGHITPIGSTMSIFPLSPRFSRTLLVGHLHECLPYTIALVAGISAPDIFLPENQVVPTVISRDKECYLTHAERQEDDLRESTKRQFNKVHKEFCSLDDKSDAIKLLQVVGEFAYEPTEAWCQLHFVQFKTLKDISQLRKQITELLCTNFTAFSALKYQEKLEPPSPKQVKALKQMIAAGFIDHVAIRADMAPNHPDIVRKPIRAADVPYLTLFPSHVNWEDDKAVYIHPSSPLAHLSPQECPEYIVYSYLQKPAATSERTPKTRMHALTDITGSQLAALAKGTPLLHYGKPIKEVMPKIKGEGSTLARECWVIPYLRAEGTGGIGWPLPARKVLQKKIPGRGWVVE